MDCQVQSHLLTFLTHCLCPYSGIVFVVLVVVSTAATAANGSLANGNGLANGHVTNGHAKQNGVHSDIAPAGDQNHHTKTNGSAAAAPIPKCTAPTGHKYALNAVSAALTSVSPINMSSFVMLCADNYHAFSRLAEVRRFGDGLEEGCVLGVLGVSVAHSDGVMAAAAAVLS